MVEAGGGGRGSTKGFIWLKQAKGAAGSRVVTGGHGAVTGGVLDKMYRTYFSVTGQSRVSHGSRVCHGSVGHWSVTTLSKGPSCRSLVGHWSVTGRSLVGHWSVTGWSLVSVPMLRI